jgi:predicted nucleic acid-binding protein
VLFDTDVLIWIQRGNHRAAGLVEREEERCISVLTYMELLQGASEKRQHEHILDFLREFSFRVLPLSENIGHRAAIYPVRNNAPLLCSGVRFCNNSGGV